MKTLDDRSDIVLLVNTFYERIRQDDLLGPIFNSHIEEDQWPEHLDKLTDFWETNLFGVARFKGSPTAKHLQVDENLDYGVEQTHFGRWLQLWFQTINELFKGENAIRAQEAARRMAHGQFMTLWHHKPGRQSHRYD